jgi:hypothetical protein
MSRIANSLSLHFHTDVTQLHPGAHQSLSTTAKILQLFLLSHLLAGDNFVLPCIMTISDTSHNQPKRIDFDNDISEAGPQESNQHRDLSRFVPTDTSAVVSEVVVSTT